MQITPLTIADVYLIKPKRFRDARGYFCETYRRDLLADAGIKVDFVQDNESLSVSSGTIRGLHYQAPPHAQAKLVRVLAGNVFDVAVDIRTGSPTYGQFVTASLGAENGEQLYLPRKLMLAGFKEGLSAILRALEEDRRESSHSRLRQVLSWRNPDQEWGDPTAEELETHRTELRAWLELQFKLIKAGKKHSVSPCTPPVGCFTWIWNRSNYRWLRRFPEYP